MSVTLYDRAVTEKIRSWILDKSMTVLDPDETRQLFMYKADVGDDSPIKLPMVTVSRGRDISIRDSGKRPQTHMGKIFNSRDGMSDHLNAIPISIPYTLNIYTRTKEQADEYVRNFAFNLVNYPTILIKIPYNDSNLAYRSFLTLGNTITDGSDIPERLIPGQFSRFVLPFSLNDAYLFSYNYRKIPRIVHVDIETSLNSGGSSVDNINNDKTGSSDSNETIEETDGFDIEIII